MAEYAYRIKHNKGSFIHLLQNGKYLSVPSFPLTPETTSPTRSGATSRATIPFQSSIREICATPFHPLRSPRVRPSTCSTRSISLLSHVSLSSLSHPATGTYAAAAEAVEYLAHLGVAAVRVLSLEPHVCGAGSTIDARCWRSLPRSLPHRQPHVVYPGIPHPSYGTQRELAALLQALRSRGVASLLDVDLSVSTASDWFDFDGTASQYAFGTLFDKTGLFNCHQRRCARPDLATGSVARQLVATYLRRFVETIGFDGLWWRNVLCLRLKGDRCASGSGNDHTVAIAFLRSLANEQWTLFGEDTNGEVTPENPNSAVKNIADSTLHRGLGFRGQLDKSPWGCEATVRRRGQRLLSATLEKTINVTLVEAYVESFVSVYQRSVITLNDPDTLLVRIGRVGDG